MHFTFYGDIFYFVLITLLLDDHEAMLSVTPACLTCGLSLEDTIGIYSSMWIDGLVRRNQAIQVTNPVNCNYTKLTESLLNPHGKGNGWDLRLP